MAAGSGQRAGGPIAKQWQKLNGQRVCDITISAFARHPHIHGIMMVYAPQDESHVATLASDIMRVTGGKTRQASVFNALKALSTQKGHEQMNVLIHDAARPCISHDLIERCVQGLHTHRACAPGLPITDALWKVNPQGQISAPQSRAHLFQAQTPQAFRLSDIWDIHQNTQITADDDVQLALAYGLDVACIEGEQSNIKITHASDFTRASKIIGGNMGMDIRLGHGFDVHKFDAPDKDGQKHIILCGIEIPHPCALLAHSDADVALHAISDAIYGALAQGDIGTHFPPSEAKWKDASSRLFLDHAVKLARDMGFRITNIDCTLICETPKIAPHALAMRENIADITGMTTDRISIKATTSETLGFTGRKEGIACIATATLIAT